MKRNEVLDTAKKLIYGERCKDYDTPKRNFQRIAIMWQEILQAPITSEQVAMCMIIVKLTRLIQSPKKEDNWVDISGYAACGAEVAEEAIVHYSNVVDEESLTTASQWGLHGGK